MFTCRICKEKDKQIEYLKKQNQDLQDRILAFAKDAFVYYKAEQKNTKEDLFPVGMDEKGNVFKYDKADLEQQKEEVFRAFGEDEILVQEEENVSEIKR